MRTTEVADARQAIHRKVLRLMGNRFEITVVSEDEEGATERIEEAIAEIRRIEAILTTFDESSQTNLINRKSGLPAGCNLMREEA